MPIIRIQGQFRAGSPPYPTLTGIVTIPRLHKVRITEFLIDTGADVTTLHPLDARQMGINFSRDFAGVPTGSTVGIGGANPYWEEAVELQFLHENLTDFDRITLPVHIAASNRVNSAFPSLLGRDVLQWYRFMADSLTNKITLERGQRRS